MPLGTSEISCEEDSKAAVVSVVYVLGEDEDEDEDNEDGVESVSRGVIAVAAEGIDDSASALPFEEGE